MTLTARPRLAILFVALAALFLSLTGTPVQAQDGSVPDQPTGLSTEASHDRVNLTWDDPNDASITHYQVLRRDRDVHDTGEFVTIDSDTGSATTSYTDDTVEPEKRYVYRVVAVNDNGDSQWSSFARANTPAAPPQEPDPTPEPNTPAIGAPTISGTVRVGETLAADTSGIYDADGLDDAVFSYQWTRNDESADADIAGATDSTYTLVDADKDKTIKVRVSFTDEGGNPESLTSPATAPVATAADETEPPGPIWSATLTVGRAGENYGYQSFLNPQAGALVPATFVLDDVTYTVGHIETAADYLTVFGVDRELPVGFTLELDGAQFESNDASLESHTYGHVYTWLGRGMDWDVGEEVTAAVAASPTLTLVVLVDPDLAPSNLKARGSGEKVTLTWDTPAKDAGSVTGYQILRGQGDGDLETLVADTQSTGTDYTDSDVSGNLTEYRYQVKALRSGEASQGSNVAEVLVALAAQGDATGAPAITGTAQVGMTLTADTSTIDDPDGTTGATFTYQWVRSDGTDTDISGATDSTYTLVAADLGKTIKVKVSFTDDNDNDETLTSEATAEVEVQTTEIWSATLTVKGKRGDIGGNNWGWNSIGGFPGSGLTSTSFPYFGQPRDILEISNHRTLTRLRVRISPEIPSGDLNKLTLHIGDDIALDFTDATSLSGHHDWTDADEFSAANTRFTDGAMLSLSITRPTEAPGKTMSLKATQKGGVQIDLSWTAPLDNGGVEITGYRIEVSSDAGMTWTDHIADTQSTSTMYSHTGLVDGDTRRYRVSAINSFDTGPASEVASATTDATPPNFDRGSCSHNACTLFFDEALATGSGRTAPPSAFAVTAGSSPIMVSGLEFQTSSELVLTGLVPAIRQGQAVKVTYKDPNDGDDEAALQDVAGNDLASFTETVTNESTLAPVVPDTPTALMAAPDGTTRIDLSWTAPEYNGGRAVEGYRIEVSADGGMNWTDLAADTASTATMYSHTSGLSSGDTRHYRVSAINSIGPGNPSNVAHAITGPRVASVTMSNIQLTSADAKAEVANLKNTFQNLYLQYREKGNPNWNLTLSTVTTGDTVTFSLAPLTEKTGYDVRASLDNSFPPGFKTVTAGFFSDSTETKVWSATMTVGTATDCPDALGWSSSSFHTCRDSGATNFEGDALTRPGFVYDNERYQFHSVEFNTDRKELSVLFGNKKENGFMEDDALRGAMTLQVGGMEFPLADGIYPGHAIYQVIAPELYSLVWENVDFSWTGGETVGLQMRMPPPAGAPLNLTYTAAILPTGGGTVTLDWDEPLSGPPEGGYRIEVLGRHHRYAVGSFQVSGDITTFTDGSGRAIHGEYTPDGLPATSGQYLGPIRLGSGQRYYYQVLALNANGKSPPSNVVEVTDATADPVASAPPGTPTGLTAEKYQGNPDRYLCVARWQFVSGDFEGLESCERPPPTIPEEYKQLQFSKTNIIVHWDRTDDPSILRYEVQWSSNGTTWNDASPHAGALNHYKYGYEWSGGFWYDESEAGYETTLDTVRIYYRVRAVNSAGESDWSRGDGNFERFPSQDFNTLVGAGNSNAQGIWSNGVTMWVADLAVRKLYAYALSTKAPDSGKDIDLSAEINIPSGPKDIWSDGETMWVVDDYTNTLFAYKLTPAADFGARDSVKDIALTSTNVNSWGIWSDGTTMWVGDKGVDKLYAYNLSTKARDSNKDIILAPDNGAPNSIWSDGTTMWVGDKGVDKLYAYNLSTKARDSNKDIILASDNGTPLGIWSDSETMWVADSGEDKIYAYQIGPVVFE